MKFQHFLFVGVSFLLGWMLFVFTGIRVPPSISSFRTLGASHALQVILQECTADQENTRLIFCVRTHALTAVKQWGLRDLMDALQNQLVENEQFLSARCH